MDSSPLHNDQLRLLWQEAAEGDTRAFYNIHLELFDGLYGYAWKLLQDKDLANDAVQELFLRIWTKRQRIGVPEKIKPYFFTALRRQIFNQLRGLRLHSRKIRMMTRPEIEFSPEEIVVREEESQTLHLTLTQLLNGLPGRQKEVIYLHYFGGLDYQQIATIMNINYQSVLNLAQKAMQKLRSSRLPGFF